MSITPNALFQADCIEVIRRLDAESIDLIYLDPPFHSQAEAGQTTGENSPQHLQYISRVCQLAHRVLKPTGVLFFHAQPLSAFSIRLILNQVFGESHFRNEIVWKYAEKPTSQSSRPGTAHDTILHFGKTNKSTDNIVFKPQQHDEAGTRFTRSEHSGAYALADLTRAASDTSLRFEWHGATPPEGRSWRFRRETLQQLEEDGRIFQRRREVPRLKIFLDEDAGVDVETIWTDIPRLSPASKENTRYPFQKPLGLLERLLYKGSNEGEVVLDPFCGSGTTIIAAERHRRRWIACDVSSESVAITTARLNKEFGQSKSATFSMTDAESLNRFAIKSTGFKRVAIRIEDLALMSQSEFIMNHEVKIEETRHVELKEIKSTAGAVNTIVNAADEYAVAFLNSEGGRVYWGIRDKDRIVVGVRLSYQERDRIRRDVSSKLNQIEPRVDPSRYRIEFHEVHDEEGERVSDTYVVEMVVPVSDSLEPYYTGGGDAWVKVDGNKQKLRGIALTDFIKQRLGKATTLQQTADAKQDKLPE
jgi:DNA modification methylase